MATVFVATGLMYAATALALTRLITMLVTLGIVKTAYLKRPPDLIRLKQATAKSVSKPITRCMVSYQHSSNQKDSKGNRRIAADRQRAFTWPVEDQARDDTHRGLTARNAGTQVPDAEASEEGRVAGAPQSAWSEAERGVTQRLLDEIERSNLETTGIAELHSLLRVDYDDHG